MVQHRQASPSERRKGKGWQVVAYLQVPFQKPAARLTGVFRTRFQPGNGSESKRQTSDRHNIGYPFQPSSLRRVADVRHRQKREVFVFMHQRRRQHLQF